MGEISRNGEIKVGKHYGRSQTAETESENLERQESENKMKARDISGVVREASCIAYLGTCFREACFRTKSPVSYGSARHRLLTRACLPPKALTGF